MTQFAKVFPRTAALGALVLTLATGTQVLANEYRGPSGTRINPVSDSVFEVVARSSTRGPDFWCGASDYARRALGRGWTDRVYVAREMGPSVTTNRRSAVHFTVDPSVVGGGSTGGVRSVNRFVVGDSMSIQQANRYCNTLPTGF